MSSVHCMAISCAAVYQLASCKLTRSRARKASRPLPYRSSPFMAHSRLSFFVSLVNSYELFIGLRYTRSRQRTRFISVISLISIVGIALGMTVLITVLSVFNGFQREVRTRMLGAVAHVQVQGFGETLPEWKSIAKLAQRNSEVQASAPYVAAQGLLTSGGHVRG